jgi:hypothetical protein
VVGRRLGVEEALEVVSVSQGLYLASCFVVVGQEIAAVGIGLCFHRNGSGRLILFAVSP